MATRLKQRRCGRRAGTRNKGYFYRKGRGWCASKGNRAVPLLREDGTPIREEKAPQEEVREAFARYTLTLKTDAAQVKSTSQVLDQITVMAVCELYLDHCAVADAPGTYRVRVDALFDFCTGLPASLRNKNVSRQEMETRRIHRGNGDKLVSQLKPLDVTQWLDAHPTWDGCKRTKVQAIKRALNFGVKEGILSRNPIKGYKVAKANMRQTYITPEQEAACYDHANSALAMAIKVCIRTGARYGCEFARLTAKHVTTFDNRMEWRFSAQESKTKKPRIVRIADPRTIEIVQEQMRKHPSGPLFRNTTGKPWTQVALKQAFSTLKARLKKHGVVLDDAACMYSCRHTFAKRTLQGYWTGKPTNIETLSILMGNSREVCWAHYAQWCDTYTEPLWSAV